MRKLHFAPLLVAGAAAALIGSAPAALSLGPDDGPPTSIQFVHTDEPGGGGCTDGGQCGSGGVNGGPGGGPGGEGCVPLADGTTACGSGGVNAGPGGTPGGSGCIPGVGCGSGHA